MEMFFAHTYLLLLGKLAIGGLLSLAVPPFIQVGGGFYTSTAAVYLAAAWLMFGGDLSLYLSQGCNGPVALLPLAAWGLFATLFSAYYLTLFIELPVLRAKLFPVAVGAGALALAFGAAQYRPETASWATAALYIVVLWTGAAVLGAAVTSMLLGHWYLIDTGLDLAPFRSMLAFCRRCLIGEVATVLLVALLLSLLALLTTEAGSHWQEAAGSLWPRYGFLLAVRGLAWAMAAGLLLMAARTLAIPQTMAATGLFYLEALVVLVGQIAGHWLLFRTGLPL